MAHRTSWLLLALAATRVRPESCSVEVVLDRPYSFESTVPPPPRDALLAHAQTFAAAHGLTHGGGCDTLECVAGRLADQLLAACAAAEYRDRSTPDERCITLQDQRVCALLQPLALRREPAVAHCVVGLARTFPDVAKSIADHMVKPLGASDAYFVLGSPQVGSYSESEWNAAFDAFPSVARGAEIKVPRQFRFGATRYYFDGASSTSRRDRETSSRPRRSRTGRCRHRSRNSSRPTALGSSRSSSGAARTLRRRRRPPGGATRL